MFKKSPAVKPLKLKVGDQELVFNSIPDFEFALAGRTAVPSDKINRLIKASIEELKGEARTIKDVEKRFVAIMSRSIEDPKSINRSLRELDPLVFSQDHNWREIIAGLNELSDDHHPYRRLALVKYMQYLAARQEIIKYIYSEKRRLSEAEGAEPGDATEFKDTVILGGTVAAEIPVEPTAENLERLPKGESVAILLPPGREMDIHLSKHKCKLRAGERLLFIDEQGKKFPLNHGRNVIGRDALSTVVIDPSWRDVSRLHLVIETLGQDSLQLTDLSSHGTFIPANYLRQTA